MIILCPLEQIIFTMSLEQWNQHIQNLDQETGFKRTESWLMAWTLALSLAFFASTLRARDRTRFTSSRDMIPVHQDELRATLALGCCLLCLFI